MARFTGFKPTGLKKIAGRLGYEGSLDNFENYLEQNPEKKRQMLVYEESANNVWLVVVLLECKRVAHYSFRYNCNRYGV